MPVILSTVTLSAMESIKRIQKRPTCTYLSHGPKVL